VKEREVQLTLTEFKILKELLAAPGQVITRSRLGDTVTGMSPDVSSRTIDVHLVALRKKMGLTGEMIETVRGVGYRFKN
jgi:two-component system alkaline phosphatase synthesis response regulator PhoP